MMTKSYRFTNTFDSIAWNFFVDNILYSVSKYVMSIKMCVWQALYYRKEHNLFYLSWTIHCYDRTITKSGHPIHDHDRSGGQVSIRKSGSVSV